MKFQFSCRVFQKLSDSEIAVSGIDASIIAEIAYQIQSITLLWKDAYMSFSHIINLLHKKSFFFCLQNNQNYSLEDMLQNEDRDMKSNLSHFQSILTDWIQSHTKDLQNYQQEIHQIHQSLSQKSSENAEVIDLLEKNFNLHLQSAQKVENSI